MNPLVIDLLYGLATAILGAAAASWLWWSHFLRGKVRGHGSAEAPHASEVLFRLQGLVARVAFDVDEYHSRVGEINANLTSAEMQEPARIVDVVAKLVDAYQRMQERLASTEDKLRGQAQEMQVHAAEARTDALTLLPNRRAFDAELARRIAEFSRHRKNVSLIMVDVDRFKTVNDMHGHQTGDEVLRGVARLLRRTMRDGDFVARYGGEEFGIILPGTNLQDAFKAAMRAGRAAVETFQFHHDGNELQVTASFGVAEALANDNAAGLIARADKALYAAKQRGRNCAYGNDGRTADLSVDGDRTVATTGSNSRLKSKPAALKREKNDQPGPLPHVNATKAKPDHSGGVEPGEVAGLPGRTIFCQQLRHRTAEWKRGGPKFSVLLIKLDQFKSGEEDDGLQTHAAVVGLANRFFAATVREMDIIGYCGPGCFGSLLPRAGLAEAVHVAQRLREEFQLYTSSAQSPQSDLTLSIGAVEVEEGDDYTSLLKRAYAALEVAERHGGNQTSYRDSERCCSTISPVHSV